MRPFFFLPKSFVLPYESGACAAIIRGLFELPTSF